jgi:predicted molibdopterin-dependent oxidoreductase YjgC
VVTPLVRKDGVLKAATWNEALDTVAARLKPLAGKKANGLAALASTRLPAESLALFKQVFAGQLGSDMVTSIEEGHPTSVSSALAAELGRPFEGTLSAAKHADAVMIVDANLIEHHMVAGFMVKRAVPQGTKVVLVDPSANPMELYAESTLKPAHEINASLFEGLCAALEQLGLAKKSMPTTGSVENLAGKAGVSAESLLEAARIIASASHPVIFYGKGITAQRDMQLLKSLVKFAEMSGVITETTSGLLNLKGEANSLAAALYGMDQVFSLSHHQAVYVALGDAEPSPRLVQKLEKAPFLVVQTAYLSQLTAQADVVLPSAKWTEQEGHYLAFDGRLQKSIKSIEPVEGIWTSDAILSALAVRLGAAPAADWKEQLFQHVSPVAISA